MVRIISVISILLLFIFPLYSQDDQGSLRQSFRFNPVRLATGTFQFEFEQQISNKWTLSFMGSGTYSAENGLGGWYLNDLKNRDNYKANIMTGLGIMFQPRYYLFDAMDEPKGLYIGPHLMYRNMWITYENNNKGNDNKDTSPLSIVAGGGVFGAQWPVFSKFVVDAYIGPVIRFSNYGYEEGPSNYNSWTALDHSGVTINFGLSIGFVK